MQLAMLETEFSPDALSRQLTKDGFSTRLSQIAPGRVIVALTAEAVEPFARAVTEFVFSDWLSDYVHQRLSGDHAYLSMEDQEYVRLLTRHTMRTEPEEVFNGRLGYWQERAAETIRSVVLRGGTVNIRGILRFRLGDFLRAVDHVVTDVVEHFLADREYEEFVSMLRVMLDAQPATTLTLHVYCTDERVWLCDAAGSLIKDQDIADVAMQTSDDGTVDAEDLTMSILIMKSPCSIVIHDLTRLAPWPSFAETVERVFLERVSHCQACSTCDRLRYST